MLSRLKEGSLVIVGSGIKFISHLSVETKSYIKQADKVLYLVNEPAMMEWLNNTNPNCEALDQIYFGYSSRQESYNEIANYIVECLKQKINLCVVIYGHPSVFAQPALDAVLQAKQCGYDAKILPAISSEDCLFADLCIDPGEFGSQSFEATDFLIYKRNFDQSSHLILWQTGILGQLNHHRKQNNTHNVQILADYLCAFYKKEHRVILYEASQYPHLLPRIDEVQLSELSKSKFSSITTLYVPPAYRRECDHEMLNKLIIS